ncbi:hypothetical protein PPERSA_06429 [Pseudocohnilembus persalinus]|uniref:B9 domain-containing protein 1 n=1 Tax=Pseudocohnilembus persalinus TaxID=266149 RepID=A0A0V0QRB5_PSEPJ|nr:hypothetical protein PPERSA_06429 [Pseudocohnilembus persalinus]|eukprot:KRX04795.1 hypothetical protein PPERSA_06429 [Pseudocohnilembus persalinus]
MLSNKPKQTQGMNQQGYDDDEQDNQGGNNQQNVNIDQLKNEALKKIDPQNLEPSYMYLSVSGVIESGYCNDENTLQIDYSIVCGEDWEFKDSLGQPRGISQKSSSHSLQSQDIVFNFPFQTTLATTSIYGWPQLILKVKGPDFFGRSVIKGYGSVHFPTQPGTHERTVRIYKPIPMSLFGGFFGFLDGKQAEYTEADKVIARGEGRDVTRVKSVGYVKVRFEVMKRNFQNFGYSY